MTLTAVGPTSADSQPITGFSIALQYNSSCVTYVRSASSPLWSDLVDAMTPNSNPTLATLRLTSNKRTGADNLWVHRHAALAVHIFPSIYVTL